MALSADTVHFFEIGDINTLVVAAGVTIYEGALVFALKADGTAVVASPAISTHVFAGIAIFGQTAGNKVDVKHRGFVEMPVTRPAPPASALSSMPAMTTPLTLTASTNVPVGYVHRHVSGTTCIVEFRSTAERDIAVA